MKDNSDSDDVNSVKRGLTVVFFIRVLSVDIMISVTSQSMSFLNETVRFNVIADFLVDFAEVA